MEVSICKLKNRDVISLQPAIVHWSFFNCMTRVVSGITVVKHDAEKCLHVDGYENPGDGLNSYSKVVRYEGI